MKKIIIKAMVFLILLLPVVFAEDPIIANNTVDGNIVTLRFGTPELLNISNTYGWNNMFQRRFEHDYLDVCYANFNDGTDGCMTCAAGTCASNTKGIQGDLGYSVSGSDAVLRDTYSGNDANYMSRSWWCTETTTTNSQMAFITNTGGDMISTTDISPTTDFRYHDGSMYVSTGILQNGQSITCADNLQGWTYVEHWGNGTYFYWGNEGTSIFSAEDTTGFTDVDYTQIYSNGGNPAYVDEFRSVDLNTKDSNKDNILTIPLFISPEFSAVKYKYNGTGTASISFSCDNGTTWASTSTQNSFTSCANAGTNSYLIVNTSITSATNTYIDDIEITAGTASTDPAKIIYSFTASDLATGDSLTSFNISLFNESNTYNFQTDNGTIVVDNSTIGFNASYSVLFNANDSLGIFTVSNFSNVNITSDDNFIANLTQSFIAINITDLLSGLPLEGFTVETNYTSQDGSNGYIIMPTKQGTSQHLNISSSQYPKLQYTYSINAAENLTFYANASPQYNFYLRRESDNSIFDVNATNSTKLTIYCPDKNIIINFKNQSRAVTEENSTINCDFSLMKIDLTYPDSSSYFRTLIPPTSQQNVTWWLLDLNVDTGVQKILELIDLTGEWTDGVLRLTSAIDQNNEDIIEQQFDVSTATTLYLLKDALYTVHLINNDGTEERQLGSLIADSAGTVTITYPNLDFQPDPDNTILENNISWSYTCPFSQCPEPYNTSDNVLRLQYVDSTGGTTSVTWKVYNGTNKTHLLQTFTSTLSDVTFSYSPVTENNTYYTDLFVVHSTYGYNITDSRIFGSSQEPLSDIPGFTEEQSARLKFFGSGLFLICWGFLFSTFHAGVGMVTLFVWTWIFKAKGWFPISYAWLAIIGFAAIIGFIYEAMKKD